MEPAMQEGVDERMVDVQSFVLLLVIGEQISYGGWLI